MAWRLEFAKDACKDLDALDPAARRRVIEKTDWLLANFDSIHPLPLSGSWKGFFKLRAGDMRIVYTIRTREGLIRVEYIDRRDRIYKRK